MRCQVSYLDCVSTVSSSCESKSMTLASGGLQILSKGPLIDETGSLGNHFSHSEKMNRALLQRNEIGKVIKELA